MYLIWKYFSIKYSDYKGKKNNFPKEKLVGNYVNKMIKVNITYNEINWNYELIEYNYRNKASFL